MQQSIHCGHFETTQTIIALPACYHYVYSLISIVGASSPFLHVEHAPQVFHIDWHQQQTGLSGLEDFSGHAGLRPLVVSGDEWIDFYNHIFYPNWNTVAVNQRKDQLKVWNLTMCELGFWGFFVKQNNFSRILN